MYSPGFESTRRAGAPFGVTAARLLADTDAELGVRKGAIWWFVHEHRHTALRAVVSPDLL